MSSDRRHRCRNSSVVDAHQAAADIPELVANDQAATRVRQATGRGRGQDSRLAGGPLAFGMVVRLVGQRDWHGVPAMQPAHFDD
jgi:hypothetical protein